MLNFGTQSQPKILADWEAKWTPELLCLLNAFHDQGVERKLWPQSRHWDWRGKIRAIESRPDRHCFAIVCEDMTQAMMITDRSKRARIESQKNEHLTYIDYLEAVPWNRHKFSASRRGLQVAGRYLSAPPLTIVN